MADEDAVANIYKKIEREKALLNAANSMLAQTDNDSVRSRLNSQIRDGRRNVQFFEEKLRELQMRRVNTGMDSMSLRSGEAQDDDGSGPPPPPPKDASGNWEHTRSGSSASYGSTQYSKIGQHGDLMPPKHPYAPPGPGSSAPKPRPNFTKLGASIALSPMPSPAAAADFCFQTLSNMTRHISAPAFSSCCPRFSSSSRSRSST